MHATPMFGCRLPREELFFDFDELDAVWAELQPPSPREVKAALDEGSNHIWLGLQANK